MKQKRFLAILGIGVIVIAMAFLLTNNAFASKKLKLNLAKFHFGSQDPINHSMPKNLELARPTWIFNWDFIEPQKGKYDFSNADKEVKRLQKRKYKILGVIIPYATWDQKLRKDYKKCKSQYKEAEKWGIKYVCNPYDWQAYKKFITKIVDRYDGDGKNDMPGLKIPIRAWEVGNEPEFQGDYYIGTPKNYARLLDFTYRTIKAEDKKAKVLNGGIAGMTQDIGFWQEVFKYKKGRKFDAVSYHCITCESETANIDRFSVWAAQNKIGKKRIWLTEWQIGGFGAKQMSDEETAKMVVKGASYAFAHKVDKIFMVEFDYMKNYTKSKLAYTTLVRKLKYFKSAKENTYFEVGNGQTVGVFEFKVPSGSTVLVAWGGGQLTLGGAIKEAIDIYGNPVTIKNNVSNLVDMPYIIEIQ